jgi:hypothetical protein
MSLTLALSPRRGNRSNPLFSLRHTPSLGLLITAEVVWLIKGSLFPKPHGLIHDAGLLPLPHSGVQDVPAR